MPKTIEAAPRVHRVTQPDALFRAVADQAPQVMWIVNPKGAVTYLNQSWYDLVGGEPPRWYGHEWGEVVEAQDLIQMRERWVVATASGSIFEGTRRVKALDGKWHTLSYKATPVFEKGQLVCWVGMDADITDMMTTAAALRFANQELEAFSYTVSHDLRTPLVTVQGFARMLGQAVQGNPNPKVGHYVERITAAVEHMGRLVDGLLALSHVTRRKLRHEDVDLSKMALDIFDLFHKHDPAREATLRVEPGMRVQADGRLMESLLENLIGNAWKFTSATQHTEIDVGLSEGTGKEWVFFVKDNGPGFEMAHATQLFSAFQRLHTASEFPGMGIGLATVSRIVARHGGRVWAESEPGKGACFFFALPVV
jgi:PAS domain S-box-containing protein